MTPWIPSWMSPTRSWSHEELQTFTVKATPSFNAGDEVIMSMVENVSRTMLSRYSHVQMEGKRGGLPIGAGSAIGNVTTLLAGGPFREAHHPACAPENLKVSA
jgi:hypothetical protein